MGGIFTVRFWVQAFISTFITMLIIYIIKQVSGKFNIPVVSDVAESI